ncbi:helix-turn-helix domain-containing protein [Streptomyces sp. NPDC087307]|uniref:helix-turn-helix domain-containing protein n=1 Tax=Streptomyces sp. NPDC087307 TaxID=3365782 RepID=UPI0037FD98CA
MSAYLSPGFPSLDRMLTAPDSSAIVLRKAIGTRMRKLRKSACISATEAAERLRCHDSKISRLECGEVPLKERDVLDLLNLCGADHVERAAAPELVALSNRPGWWKQQYGSVVPEWFDKLIGLQEGASVIWTYEVLLVPGLLQTRQYAFAVTKSGFPLADRVDIEARVDLRMERQEILGKQGGPRLWALMDSGVLERPIGSREVMRGQIERLITLTEHPRITLQLVPKDFVTVTAPVTLIRFPLELPDIVYLEKSLDADYLDRPKQTEHFRALLDPLSTIAHNPAQTRLMLIEALKLYR